MANPLDEIRKMRGLWTHPNPLTAPDGALLVADNAEITREDMISTRKGFADFSSNLPDALPKSMFSNGSRTTPYLELDSLLWRYDTSGAQWNSVLRQNNRAFGNMQGVWINQATNVMYISDNTGSVVWSWNLSTGLARIIAGTWKVPGNSVGTVGIGQLSQPNQLWGDAAGNIYVCDTVNHCIRKIDAAGAMTTFAGTAGTSGTANGAVGVGRFNQPRGIWGDGAGNLFIADTNNNAIRKVVIATGVISNVAGTIGTPGSANGAIGVGQLNGPCGIWGNAYGSLYICDPGNAGAIRECILATGVLSTPITLPAACYGITGDIFNTLYIASDANNGDIYAAQPNFSSYNLLLNRNANLFYGGMTIDATGNVYRVKNNGAVLKIYPSIPYAVSINASSSSPLAQSNYHGSILNGPDSRRMKAVEQKGAVFFTTQRGIMKIPSAGALMMPAGLPRGLDITATDPGVTGILLPIGSSVAYRVRFGYRHPNGRIVLGAASTRCVFKNGSAGVRNVNLSIPIPAETPDTAFVQVYRTLQSTGSPDDEMAQIFERVIQTAEMTSGVITLTDSTPDIFRGANLETNDKQQGPGQTNDPPPYALDVSRQKDLTLYARTKLPQRLTIQMLGVAGLTAATSTVTINGIAYACAVTENTATGAFAKSTAGTDAQNTEATAKSLCNVINKYPGNQDIYAYYVSGPSDPPGRILLQHRYFNAAAWPVVADSAATGGSFSPSLPTSGTSVTSNDESRGSRVYISKVGQPEHVPWGENFIDVGGDEEGIQRILELRDANIVIKDRSIWRIVGDTPQNLRAFPLDNTVAIMGRDTAVVLNNQVFCLTNQGVVAISDTGVQIVSRQIEAQVLYDVMMALNDANGIDAAHAVAQEVERCYRVWLYNAELNAQIAWKFNTVTMAWTRELTHASCATVVNDDVLYGLFNGYGHVLRQRRGSGGVDTLPGMQMRDPAGTVQLTGADSFNGQRSAYLSNFIDGVNWSPYTTTYGPIGVGWAVQLGGGWAMIIAMNGNLATFDRSVFDGTSVCQRPIPMLVEFAPRAVGKNFDEKQFGEVQIVAECEAAVSCTVGFVNEQDIRFNSLYQGYTAAPPSLDVAVDAFNPVPPNIGQVRSQPGRRIRVEVARSRSRGAQLGIRIFHGTAFSLFNIRSVGIETVDTGGHRTQR